MWYHGIISNSLKYLDRGHLKMDSFLLKPLTWKARGRKIHIPIKFVVFLFGEMLIFPSVFFSSL